MKKWKENENFYKRKVRLVVLLFFSMLIFSLGLTDAEINYAFQLIPQQGFYVKSPINKKIFCI